VISQDIKKLLDYLRINQAGINNRITVIIVNGPCLVVTDTADAELLRQSLKQATSKEVTVLYSDSYKSSEYPEDR